jgi:hypothetical protein
MLPSSTSGESFYHVDMSCRLSPISLAEQAERVPLLTHADTVYQLMLAAKQGSMLE